jgi:hypothetical protein
LINLEHGDSDGTGETEKASTDVGGGASVLSWGRVGGGGSGDGDVASRGLELAVGDLGDGSASRSLELTVGDLGDRSASRGLNLSVTDLGDWGAGRSLELTVTDLGDGGTSGLLDLTVTDLGDNSGAGDLTIGHLRSDGGGGDLAVRDLGSAAATVDGLDVDWAALLGNVLVVEVVEGTAQALVEGGVTADGERAVVADGETRGELGVGLAGRWVELELLVGDDVTNTALGVGEDTVLERDDESGGLTLEVRLVFAGMKPVERGVHD